MARASANRTSKGSSHCSPILPFPPSYNINEFSFTTSINHQSLSLSPFSSSKAIASSSSPLPAPAVQFINAVAGRTIKLSTNPCPRSILISKLKACPSSLGRLFRVCKQCSQLPKTCPREFRSALCLLTFLRRQSFYSNCHELLV